ncbi:PucR family transcriptional regulator [Aestuariivirga sp.]|uniref:PucR family transcriptional regulator n=1 Tax=Aestuariivirga sp. TaxID=2650926 RepID=UPI003BACB5C8
MLTQSHLNPLRRSLADLSALGVIPHVHGALALRTDAAAQALRDAVLAEVPAFATSANPQVLPGLSSHWREHVDEICRLMEEGTLGEFGFVRSHARLRAEQRFPLEVSLHAYRCGHRVLSHWLRGAVTATLTARVEQAVAAVADFAIEYTNAVSVVAAAEYVDRTRALAEAEGNQRTELLSILLSGYDEADGRIARLLKRAGYLEQRQAYCVVLVQPVNATEMEHSERAQRIIASLGDCLAGTSIRLLAGVRNNLVTAILSDRRRQSGWTAPSSTLAQRAYGQLQVLGPAVLTGISADHPSTAFLPKAQNEAAIALDFASVATRVQQFSMLPVRGLLVRRGADDIRSTPPQWLVTLIEADEHSRGSLISTLHALADADMNVQKAARRMGKHANTLYARLERIREITGRDGQRYHDLTELLLAADCTAG